MRTLLIILLVTSGLAGGIAIVGYILASQHSAGSRLSIARADISSIQKTLDKFHQDTGSFPKELEKVQQDPWGNNYIYSYPGKHNTSSYDLLSVGPDAKEGTEDDIGNWATK